MDACTNFSSSEVPIQSCINMAGIQKKKNPRYERLKSTANLKLFLDQRDGVSWQQCSDGVTVAAKACCQKAN